jgi:hypothetical protein
MKRHFEEGRKESVAFMHLPFPNSRQPNLGREKELSQGFGLQAQYQVCLGET